MRLDWICFWSVVGLGVLVGHCTGSAVAFTRKINPKIVIVGAGPSGIASAVQLLDYGFEDVTILEAEPRIGGRIYTIPFGKNVIDLGAQWCHGEAGNIVYDLAYKEGLLEHSYQEEVEDEAKGDYTYSYRRSNGEKLKLEISERLENITEKIRKDRQKEVSQYNGSLGSYMKEKFYKIMALPENDDIDKKIAQEFYENYEKAQSSDEGSDSLDVISSRDYTIFQEIEGDYELHWKDKGYKVFLNLMMKTNETGTEYGILSGRIKLKKKVDQINWKRDDYKALVKCEDGEEFLADHVIVTVSLGVLKESHEHMFEPPLPKKKQNAIKAMGFGSFGKVFLEFSEPFWAKRWGGLSMLWRDEDLAEIRGTNRSWLEDLHDFNTLPSQPNILEGWIVSDGARHLETLSSDQIKADCLYILSKFMKSTVPEPKNITISTWYSNPNFRGCYSYHSLETEKADVNNQDLANPIKNCDVNNYVDMCEKPVLQFAGEATESYHYATVHGAVETGFREAQRLRLYYDHERI